jgi:hypothetical protein
MKNITTLHPGRYYHIFNRGNNREDLFREERNYRYFLKLYAKHVHPNNRYIRLLSDEKPLPHPGSCQRNFTKDLTGLGNP